MAGYVHDPAFQDRLVQYIIIRAKTLLDQKIKRGRQRWHAAALSVRQSLMG